MRPTEFLTAANLLIMAAPTALGEAIPVELKKGDQGWQLYRHGEPYVIRGAGGDGPLETLAAAGANSLRTWGADDIDARLDEAHALGLTVTVGIWLGHERHGFDYGDEKQVRAQLERAREIVLRYKDHPAVLVWGIGNEMEGYESGDDPAIWKAVNVVAAMVKSVDPHHPTMTVTADIGGGRVEAVSKLCPAIDIHGINTYGGALSIHERYVAAGGTKPYVLTEFGPPGAWEVEKTAWGAPYELTSSDKAAFYRRSYEAAVAGAPGLALGSYAFVWGFKMEATATWFGMFLPDGAGLGQIDAMTTLWTGTPPADRAPMVEPLVVDGETRVKPGATIRVRAVTADPDGGPVRARWALRIESDEYMTGGDFRRMLPDIDGAIVEARTDGAVVRMPDEPGPYRLFLYAYDDAGKAATANVPLLVEGETRRRFPVLVYHDGFEAMPWVPSGWMGATDALSLDGDHTDNPHSGDRCIRLHYTGELGWVGVAWQNPPNNWGEKDGGFDVGGARELELWARGEYGGEKINIGVGLIGRDKPYPDSDRRTVEGIVLSRKWQRFAVPLKRMDLSSLKTGFVVTLTGRRGSAVTVYLDDIRFVR